jgi:hypothetical protein
MAVRNLARTCKTKGSAYCVVAVVFAAFVFFAFVFLVFVVVVVSPCPGVANTGIASEKAITDVNNSVSSFFMLGLDLLRDYFPLCMEQGMGHFSAIALEIVK